MNKHLLLLLSSFIIASTAFAQYETVVVGTKTDGSELTAKCYTFQQRVENIQISTSNDYLCISFRETTKSGKYLKNKGEIGLYDTKSKELKWKQPFDYSATSTSCLSNGILTKKQGNKIALLSKDTGLEEWRTEMFPVYMNDSLGILLGYKNASSDKLTAIDLKTGNELWFTKIPHKYGWNEVTEAGNNILLIVADDLHKLDITTGEMLTIEGKPGAHDTKAAILQGLVAVGGAALGAAASGGYFYGYVPVQPNTITGLTSNVLCHDSLYYWADRQQMSCIDTAFNVVWTKEFPDVKGARSKLFVQDDKIYMLNYGYGLRDGSVRRKYGRPFIACYNPKNGEEIFFNKLSVKKDMIEDALRNDDAIYMLFDDGMAHQELTDSVVNIVAWDIKQHGNLNGILPPTLYVASEDTTSFRSLAYDGEHCLVYNDKGVVYQVDKNLTIGNSYERARIYSPEIYLKNHICVGNSSDYWFIHEIGMPMAHLTIKFKRACVVDNTLLLLNYDNQFLLIDLDEATD